jgi:hypothetical protein
MAPIRQNLAAVPAKYQPQYDQNAVTEQSNLKRALENAANYGQLGGGAYQQWQLDASGNRQNADTAVNANKASDLTNYGNQINDLTGKINTFNSNGQSDLATLLGKSNSDYNGAVNTQKNSEAAAAQAEYDKQAALQNAQIVAEINHSGGSGGSGGSGTAAKALTQQQLNTAVKGMGPDNALNYLDQSGLGGRASEIPYSGVMFDTSGQPHVLGTLDDYATAIANGWVVGGSMYNNYGAHAVNSLNDYRSAISQGMTAKPIKQTTRGMAQ